MIGKRQHCKLTYALLPFIQQWAGEEGQEWALEKLGPTGEARSQDLLTPEERGQAGVLGSYSPAPG